MDREIRETLAHSGLAKLVKTERTTNDISWGIPRDTYREFIVENVDHYIVPTPFIQPYHFFLNQYMSDLLPSLIGQDLSVPETLIPFDSRPEGLKMGRILFVEEICSDAIRKERYTRYISILPFPYEDLIEKYANKEFIPFVDLRPEKIKTLEQKI